MTHWNYDQFSDGTAYSQVSVKSSCIEFDDRGGRFGAPPLFNRDGDYGLYIARRLFWTLIVVAARARDHLRRLLLLPAGDPALRFAGKNPTPAELDLIRHRLGLDQAWYVQFGKFVKTFFTGDQYGWPGLGYTFAGPPPSRPDHGARAAHAPPDHGRRDPLADDRRAIGVISAVKRRTVVDRAAMGFALFGISAPVFWLGLMALCIFWRQLGWTAAPATSPSATASPASSRT